MNIKLDTALFGEKSKAHSLLSSSDDEYAKFLTAMSDLPIELPNSAGLTPMLSGFPFAGRYVFLSSVRDADATRGGMAKTSCLIADLAQVGMLHDISDVIAQLAYTLPHFREGTAVEVITKEDIGNFSSPGTVTLARALIASRTSQPIIWLGNDGYYDALVGLWRGLPASLRMSFTYRYCCTPRDGRLKGSSLICTPIDCRSRWKEYVCIEPPLDDTPGNLVERLFTNDSARRSVLKWGQELEVLVTTFDIFRLLAESQDIYNALHTVSDLDVTVLSRNLARLVPDPLKGRGIKKQVLLELEHRIIHGTLATIGYVRNIVAAEFQSGFDVISQAVASRFARALSEGDDTLPILSQEALEDSSRPWAVGIISSLREALVKNMPAALQALLTLLSSSKPDNVESWLLGDALLAMQVEQGLLKNSRVKKLFDYESLTLASFCKRAHWAQLHARVAAAFMSPAEALYEQLSFVDNSENGIDELASCLGPREFVKVAAVNEHATRLLDQIVDACAADIDLLDMFTVVSPVWRAVVCRVIVKAVDKINMSSVLDDQVAHTWQLLVKGDLCDEQYLKAISQTKYANLLEVAERSKVLSALPKSVTTNYTKVTGLAWITRHEALTSSAPKPEYLLAAEVILAEHRNRLLPVAGDNSVSKAVQVFNDFPELGPTDFDNWRVQLLSNRAHLQMSEAKMIGMLVSTKKWKSCANELLADYVNYSRYDLHYALCECENLFGWITRYRYSISKELPTLKQWWKELFHILLYLYPEGPSDKHIWERCGGSMSDLSTRSVGKDQWRKVLSDLRKGAYQGEATIGSLISECRNDYGGNADLALLINHCPFDLKLSSDDSFID
jgi:hypothetical protein